MSQQDTAANPVGWVTRHPRHTPHHTARTWVVNHPPYPCYAHSSCYRYVAEGWQHSERGLAMDSSGYESPLPAAHLQIFTNDLLCAPCGARPLPAAHLQIFTNRGEHHESPVHTPAMGARNCRWF